MTCGTPPRVPEAKGAPLTRVDLAPFALNWIVRTFTLWGWSHVGRGASNGTTKMAVRPGEPERHPALGVEDGHDAPAGVEPNPVTATSLQILNLSSGLALEASVRHLVRRRVSRSQR
jgi:hypothetical protein